MRVNLTPRAFLVAFLVLAVALITVVATGCTTPYGLPAGLKAPTASQASMLYRLRMCETGGNYGMHTWVGGREYGGAYGFDTVFWRAQGHRPDPQYASPALQDAVELADIAALGVRRSNPGCAAKLGLR